MHLHRGRTAAVPEWVAATRLQGLLQLLQLGTVGLVLLGTLAGVHTPAEGVGAVADTAQCQATDPCMDTRYS